jgi:hypothetical protein
MNAQAAVLETASIQQQCKVLRLPAIAAQCGPLAEQAVRERHSHLGFLELAQPAHLRHLQTAILAACQISLEIPPSVSFETPPWLV